jgi:hypothetical protein
MAKMIRGLSLSLVSLAGVAVLFAASPTAPQLSGGGRSPLVSSQLTTFTTGDGATTPHAYTATSCNPAKSAWPPRDSKTHTVACEHATLALTGSYAEVETVTGSFLIYRENFVGIWTVSSSSGSFGMRVGSVRRYSAGSSATWYNIPAQHINRNVADISWVTLTLWKVVGYVKNGVEAVEVQKVSIHIIQPIEGTSTPLKPAGGHLIGDLIAVDLARRTWRRRPVGIDPISRSTGYRSPPLIVSGAMDLPIR